MCRDLARVRYNALAPLRTATILLVFAIVAGCAAAPRAANPTPTTRPTSIPTMTPTPAPSLAPGPTTTPFPTANPSTACNPTPGVQPVSPVVIRNGNTSKMQVSLTFDSDGITGKGDDTARQYLNILRDQNIHATFFLTGLFASAHPDIVRRILAEGHDLGNHTLDHPNLVKPPRADSFICAELTQAEQMIVAAGGHTSRPYFRPPFGSYNNQVRSLAARLGYRTIFWSVDPRDWESTVTAQTIISRVLNSTTLKPGAIILMHINSTNEKYALPTIIAGLEQRGYTIVPLSQLLQ